MNRRDALKRMMAAGLGGAAWMTRDLLAQEPGRAQVGSQPLQGTDSTARVPRPAPGNLPQQLDPELEQILQQWEQRSSQIERLHGEFNRAVYDYVDLIDRRAMGEFWYQQPDKGRMDLRPSERVPEEPVPNRGKIHPNGAPFMIHRDQAQRWVCTGREILIIDDEQKFYSRFQIPAHLQGDNIVNGPLPFLFGLKAEQAKQRYRLELGGMHNPDGRLPDRPRFHHIIAHPLWEPDQLEWGRAEVLLDARQFVPVAIRLQDPSLTVTQSRGVDVAGKETVYDFPIDKLRINPRGFTGILSSLIGGNPFDVRIPNNYQLLQDSRTSSDGPPAPIPQSSLP